MRRMTRTVTTIPVSRVTEERKRMTKGKKARKAERERERIRE